MSLNAAHLMNTSLAVRWAALTHDLGKALTTRKGMAKACAHEARGLGAKTLQSV